MPDTFSAANREKSREKGREKRIVQLLTQSAWYVLPVGLVTCALIGAARMIAPSSEPPINSNTSNTDDGPLVCREPDWDFGQIKQDSPKSFVHNFVLENRSDQVITISRITTNCGCAVADSAQRTIAPFGQSIVQVKIEVQGAPGPLSKTVTVFYGGEDTKKLELTMHGTITASAMLTALPKQIHFGTLNSNQSGQVSRSFTICRYDHTPLEIIAVESDVQGIEFTISLHEHGGDIQNICDIKAVIDPKKFCQNKPPGRILAKVIVRTKHKDYSSCIIPLVVNIE